MPAPAVARTTVPPLGLQLSFAQYRHDIISTAPVVAPAPTVSLPSPHTDDVFAEDGDLLNAPTDVLVTDYEDQALLMALFTDPE